MSAVVEAAPGGSRAMLERRARFLRWLRAVHGWFGLGGAAMGLFFGATGIVMNHRAVLKLPLKRFEQQVVRIELPQPAGSPEELARLLEARLGLQGRKALIRVESASRAVWNGTPVLQPERWHVAFEGAKSFDRADYWTGDRTVTVMHADANLVATLTRLHQAIGVGALWVLVADAVAGSLIVLALSGLLLWSRLRLWRLASVAAALAGCVLAAFAALSAL